MQDTIKIHCTGSGRNIIELRTASFLIAFVSQIHSSTAMLRINRISGEELTVALEEDLITDVRALKQHLNQRQGLPPRFRQRLLLDGQCLEDTATVHAAMELEVLVLAFIPNPSLDAIEEFTAAAGAGRFDKVHALKKAQLRKPRSEQIMQCSGADVLKLKCPAVCLEFRSSPCCSSPWTPMKLTSTTIQH